VRTLTAQETKTFSNPDGWGVWSRFWIKDASGAWQDLTSLAGMDWLLSWSYRVNVDDQAATLNVQLARESYQLSLATLVAGSKLNSGGPLVRANAEVKMEVACVPVEATPAAGDWRMIFHGYVDDVDWGEDPITLDCRDLAARLQRRYIRRERPYSTVGGVSCESLIQAILDDNFAGEVWAASHQYYVGDIVRATVSGTVYTFRASNQSLSGGSTPTWTATLGGTVTDGSLSWTNIGSGQGITLQTPSPSLWVIPGPWTQQKKSVMDAIQELAGQLGWALRYVWNGTVGDFALTFFEPGRAKVTPDWTISASQYWGVKRLKTSAADVRNWIQVTYGDTSSTDNVGNPGRKFVQARDATSIGLYDEQFMEITESASSHITSASTAQTLANNCLADLKDPKAEHEITCPFFWPVELGDLWQFNANGIHYDSAQKFAIVEIEHSVSVDAQETRVLSRGSPVASYKNWLERGARPGVAPAPPLVGPPAASSVATAVKPGGASIRFAPPSNLHGANYAKAELHLSTVSGFTPSASTLKAQTGDAANFEVGSLTSGTTYYAQVLAKDEQGNLGTSSGQFSFVAGYTRPLDMQPSIGWGNLPLNGDFEASADGVLPDSWAIASGTGTGAGFQIVSSTALTGRNSLQVSATASGRLESQLIPVKAGQISVTVYASSKAVSGSGLGPNVTVRFYDGAGSALGGGGTLVTDASFTAQWVTKTQTIAVTTGAAYWSVSVTGRGSGNPDAYVDSVVAVPNVSAPGAKYTGDGVNNQTIANNTITVVTFPNRVYDTDLAFNGSTFTVPSNMAGAWLVTAFVRLASPANLPLTAGVHLEMFAEVNGGSFNGADGRMNDISPGGVQAGGAVVVKVNAGDTIDVRCWQNTGASLTLFNGKFDKWVSFSYVGPLA
jgi:hypothetical protein